MRTLAALLIACTVAAAEPVIPASGYAARRARVAQSLGPNSMLILTSAEPARRNGDVDWPYRQDDNLYYLTGIAQPNTTLVLLPGEKQLSEIVFVSERNPQAEVWTGRILSQDEVKAKSGIKTVASGTSFDFFLRAALQNFPYPQPSGPATLDFSDAVYRGEATVWFVFDRRPGLNTPLTPALENASKLRERYPELRVRDAHRILYDLRMVKDAGEIEALRRAIDITVETQKVAMKRAQTATNEREIYAVVEQTFLDRGACCWAFPSIVAAGPNTTTLHYQSNDAPVARDNLVLTDIGADYEGYSADVTRTYPANGTFSAEQRAIYEAVLRAQDEALRMIKPGVPYRDLAKKANDSLAADLLKLGLITKNDPEQARMYVLHGLGHPIGLQVHDVQQGMRPLEPGMVVTIEPGLYVRKDDVLNNPTYKRLSAEEQKSIAAAVDRYANIGVRIEDDVLVTKDGYALLSAGAPRTVEAIEAFLAK